MTVGELKEAIANVGDDVPVILRLDEDECELAWTKVMRPDWSDRRNPTPFYCKGDSWALSVKRYHDRNGGHLPDTVVFLSDHMEIRE